MEWIFLGLAILLVFANGFFVATEFAIVKIRATRLQALVDEGRPGSGNALKMVEKLDAYLSATQFGITLASLGLGWLGEPAFAHLLEPLIGARQRSRSSHYRLPANDWRVRGLPCVVPATCCRCSHTRDRQ
jgi:CBS domain containing-hemolysin-like protein